MNFYPEIEKKRFALAVERSGVSEEFFAALFAAANVPEGANIDHTFAKVRYFLVRRLLPAIYLDKEQFPLRTATAPDNSSQSNETESGSVVEDTAILLESVARLRHEYSKVFGVECFTSPNLSLLEEIGLLEDAIETGKPYAYWPEGEHE